MTWGPYKNAAEARKCLGAYADAVLGPHTGVLWTAGGGTTWLRRPTAGPASHRISLLVRCTPAPHPPPLHASTMERIEAVLKRAGSAAVAHAPDAIGMTMGLPPGALGAANRYVVQPADGFLNRHPAVKDGLIVAGEVAGVVAGIAVVFTCGSFAGLVAAGIGAIATVAAGVACLVLLFEDGQHFLYTFTGNEAGRIALEKRSDYRWIEAIAPWFTLPDLAVGGRTVFREVYEAGKLTSWLGPRVARSATGSNAAARNLRLTIAEDQSAQAVHQAGIEAQKRAEIARNMKRLAEAANRQMLQRRNAVLATGGGVWGAREYANEPPALTEQAVDWAKENIKKATEAGYERLERALGLPRGGAARPGTAAHLLTPAIAQSDSSRTNLHIMTMVHHDLAKKR